VTYSVCTGMGRANGREEKQKNFCTALAEKLVDNQYDNVGSYGFFYWKQIWTMTVQHFRGLLLRSTTKAQPRTDCCYDSEW
jgi:hypothetical protein